MPDAEVNYLLPLHRNLRAFSSNLTVINLFGWLYFYEIEEC